MNSKARVEAALRGDKVDRPPAGAWGHTYREEWSPEELAAVTVERARRFGWDFVKLQPRATFFAEAFGNRYHPAGHRLRGPILDEAVVPDLGSWERLRLVEPSLLAEQNRALALVVKELGPDVPVIQTVFSPASVASYLVARDSRRLVRELRTRPELVVPALERVQDALIDFARGAVAAGAAGIFYAISHLATPDVMPLEVYEELLLPMDLRLLDSLPASAWFNAVHLCGGRQYFEIAKKFPVQAVSYSIHSRGNLPLARVQEITGKAVMGGLEQRRVLAGGPAAAIREQVAEAIADTGGRGLLLAPGCSVPPRARPENLAVMSGAAAAV
ncbi:MAG: uroporphyrinogen decarboxylase family protein [Candidatus Dormibacteraeota bacterium]|nr:uroporphyrinogen decarboxylase family protein [Candidatus Dormibacteraeota bacterium]